MIAAERTLPLAHVEKARLIAGALSALVLANKMDEHESIALTSWVAWYDATIPNVRDIKILAGAMEIEMHRRRGEQVEAEGERRGGLPSKVTQRVTLDPAERKQRFNDRALNAQPERLTAFVQHEMTAGRVPSVRGALKAVKAKSPTDPKRNRLRAQQTRVRNRADRWIGVLETVADGERRTDAQLTTVGIDVPVFLPRVRLIPWLAIDRTVDGTTFVIDEDLRAICDGRAPRPTLGPKSIRQFLLDLRTEITRRRKENHDDYRLRKWNSELVRKVEQSALLDWIEDELMKVPN